MLFQFVEQEFRLVANFGFSLNADSLVRRTICKYLILTLCFILLCVALNLELFFLFTVLLHRVFDYDE